MYSFEIILLLMAVAILLVGVAQTLHIPYPIILVIGGAVLGFVPGIEEISFDPRLILTIVLPPILYIGAYEISYREFKENIRTIISLAMGLVIVNTLVIGLIFKWLFPDLPWALAFAFGAIISPPDAITASTILKRFSITPRLLTVLEGESLINDAFALVLYKMSVVALLTGVFSWSTAGFEFIKVVLGGIFVGFVAGYTIQTWSSRYLSPLIGTLFSFVIPYVTFIIANRLGFSGVLAVVINGLILARMVMKHHDSQRHLLAVTIWNIFIIFLNCFVFILIGLQMGIISQKLSFEQMGLYIVYAIFITFVMILIRQLWINGKQAIAYFQARYSRKPSTYCNQILREGLILGSSGMLGIVTMTAVLGLPFTDLKGIPIEGRSIVIFITFFVILLTLILPGFALPKILQWLNMQDKKDVHAIHHHRKKLLGIAEDVIQAQEDLDQQERSFLLNYFKTRYRIFEIFASTESEFQKLEDTRRKILKSQREFLHEMEEGKEIDSKLLKILERELDLEESLSIQPEIK